jgi:hypothetical protein
MSSRRHVPGEASSAAGTGVGSWTYLRVSPSRRQSFYILDLESLLCIISTLHPPSWLIQTTPHTVLSTSWTTRCSDGHPVFWPSAKPRHLLAAIFSHSKGHFFGQLPESRDLRCHHHASSTDSTDAPELRELPAKEDQMPRNPGPMRDMHSSRPGQLMSLPP